MRKKSKVGWIKDGRVCYDPDTGKVKEGLFKKDTTLRYFEFAPDVLLDRLVLRLPLIAKNKKFWSMAKQKSIKVKVTVELL